MSPWERRKALFEVNFLRDIPSQRRQVYRGFQQHTLQISLSGLGEALRERGAIRDCKSGSKLFRMSTGGTLVSFPGLGFLPGDQPARHDPGPTSFGGIFWHLKDFNSCFGGLCRSSDSSLPLYSLFLASSNGASNNWCTKVRTGHSAKLFPFKC